MASHCELVNEAAPVSALNCKKHMTKLNSTKQLSTAVIHSSVHSNCDDRRGPVSSKFRHTWTHRTGYRCKVEVPKQLIGDWLITSDQCDPGTSYPVTLNPKLVLVLWQTYSMKAEEDHL